MISSFRGPASISRDSIFQGAAFLAPDGCPNLEHPFIGFGFIAQLPHDLSMLRPK